ncbi:MAG: hypothetical protein P0116_06790 [Candidatus Nitrosocosmicus sp.]|nr:hypothetical protein [Candidatus Nitrosocosmicus sp.]
MMLAITIVSLFVFWKKWIFSYDKEIKSNHDNKKVKQNIYNNCSNSTDTLINTDIYHEDYNNTTKKSIVIVNPNSRRSNRQKNWDALYAILKNISKRHRIHIYKEKPMMKTIITREYLEKRL